MGAIIELTEGPLHRPSDGIKERYKQTIMKFDSDNEPLKALRRLLKDIKSGEQAYATLIRADRFPKKSPYFKKRYFQLAEQVKLLARELIAIFPMDSAEYLGRYRGIFSPMEKAMLEKSLSQTELDALLLQKERELLLCYQRVLAHGTLPIGTACMLQTWIEELNGQLLELSMDLLIKSHGKKGRAVQEGDTIAPCDPWGIDRIEP